MKLKKHGKYFLRVFLGVLFLLVILIFTAEYIVCSYRGDTFSEEDLAEVPQFKTGLLLGTSKYVIGGSENLYYKYRLEALYDLWQQDKIKYILISGDNSSRYYNEPQTFKKDLLALGVPDSLIYLDYAGFRTFDSVVRAKEVFQQDSILIVSQFFQNLRALFIADKKGLYARAYNAPTISRGYDFPLQFRERMARVKALMDIYLLKTRPKYLGDPIEIQ